MAGTEFERAIGWNGEKLIDLVGRDITIGDTTIGDQGEERRGPISRIIISIEPAIKIEFRVSWIASKEDGQWRLESEPEEPEKDIAIVPLARSDNTPVTTYRSGEIHFGVATIHAIGDNIPKPTKPIDTSTYNPER